MGIVRVQHIFKGSSLLPKDQYVNTFYFAGPGGFADTGPVTSAHGNALMNAVSTFYGGVGTGRPQPLNDFIALQTLVPTSSVRYKVYDMEQPAPRAPIYEYNVSHAAFGTSLPAPLPSEVAVCLSYRGAVRTYPLPLARRRGRIFIGPLNITALDSVTTQARPKPAFLDALRGAAIQLAADVRALSPSWRWCMYSPTTASLVPPGGTDPMWAATEIDQVSTDDAFDTQRRRGVQPFARVLQPVVIT